ncbi:ECF transporter S component [Streptococcus macacae]|uniref:ECF-type riboflavin transporter, S component n=1 Tax=Streptococcus macacae NCTC 11558 TaxID=764298 RepID=G5JV80_9STRE|nr:ECF transporter S component [Streptococcus macacae]EHJ53317.1 hypothetical protein STRMA_1790 [Streptococcus macacae NCTC 11558]SUN77707.1 membrane protein [Streptococcus macacae NCTC 11558]
MKRNNLQTITLLAILAALSVVFGLFVKIPTPTGFLTLLDAGIYFTAFYLGAKEAAFVGALAGFLIDLISGYPNWMFISLVAHGSQGYFAGWTGKKQILGLLLASLAMIGIYLICSIPMYGLGASIAGVWGNVLQNFFGMVVGYTLNLAYKRVNP